MAKLTGIAHMVLRVTDWRRSAAWYQDVLGFERRKGEGFSGYSHPDGSFVLLFKQVDEPIEASSAQSQRLEHLAILVPSEEDLVAWRDSLVAKGLPATIDRVGVGASITLYDPDGLEVELFTPAPGGVLDVCDRPSALSQR
jgi:catechol 2,3-dioxygenase-like lactoylglutathione lyase family enzyme